MKKLLIIMLSVALVSVGCSPANKKSSNSKPKAVEESSVFQQRLASAKDNVNQKEQVVSSLPPSPPQQPPSAAPTSSQLAAQSISPSELNELIELRNERKARIQSFNDSVVNLKAEFDKYKTEKAHPNTVPDRTNLNRLITARDVAKQKLADFTHMKKESRLQELESKPGAPQEDTPLKLLDDVLVQAK